MREEHIERGDRGRQSGCLVDFEVLHIGGAECNAGHLGEILAVGVFVVEFLLCDMFRLGRKSPVRG
jgi:hypothetical protein